MQVWLQNHAGVEVVACDRSLEYARGVIEGVPAALQVADRWHLLKNLSETTERALQELYPKLKKRMAESQTERPGPKNGLRDAFPRPRSGERADQESRLKQMRRYELIRYLSANGLSHRRIATLLNLSRTTVIRHARAETFPERLSRARIPSVLDPYLPYLEGRFPAGCDNARQLWREIVKQGYPGSPSQVRKWMTWRRKQPEESVQQTTGPPPAVLLLPTAKALTRLLGQEPNALTEQDAWLRKRLCTILEIVTVAGLVNSFQTMVRERQPEALDGWLDQCHESRIGAFQRFASSLAHDGAAVRAALEMIWSNGQTEGQINRLKLLKRQMYGRSKLDLLRRRVLYQE